jgi:hypothetical protein
MIFWLQLLGIIALVEVIVIGTLCLKLLLEDL